METIKLKDIINKLSQVANFVSQKYVLRLPDCNLFSLNGAIYEMRLFTFYLKSPIENVNNFSDYVKMMCLEETELQVYPPHQNVPFDIYSFSKNDDKVYIILSIAKA